MKIVSECLFCGSPRHVFRFQAPDRWFEVPGLYKMYECRDCGLLFLNPQPTPLELAAHYPAGYYSFEGERPDVGCGSGHFLAMTKKVLKVEAYGVEPYSYDDARDEQVYEALYGRNSSFLKRLRFSPYRVVLRTMVGRPGQRVLDAAFAEKNNLRIFQGTLEQASFPDNFFDVITLNHVFEHLDDPRPTLRELRRILKHGGTLILAVPQRSCLLYWLFGRSWVQLDVPRHLFLPSRKNLEDLAVSLGFKTKGVRYNGRPEHMLDTLYYWRNGILGRKRYLYQHKRGQLAFRALLPLAYLFNFLRVGDQIELLLTTDVRVRPCISAPPESN